MLNLFSKISMFKFIQTIGPADGPLSKKQIDNNRRGSCYLKQFIETIIQKNQIIKAFCRQKSDIKFRKGILFCFQRHEVRRLDY